MWAEGDRPGVRPGTKQEKKTRSGTDSARLRPSTTMIRRAEEPGSQAEVLLCPLQRAQVSNDAVRIPTPGGTTARTTVIIRPRPNLRISRSGNPRCNRCARPAAAACGVPDRRHQPAMARRRRSAAYLRRDRRPCRGPHQPPATESDTEPIREECDNGTAQQTVRRGSCSLYPCPDGEEPLPGAFFAGYEHERRPRGRRRFAEIPN